MWFAGIDLGWQGAPSGVALLAFRPPHHLSLVSLDRLPHHQDLLPWLISHIHEAPCFAAFDAPVIVTNPSGMREADKLTHRLFGAQNGGAYPIHLGMPFVANILSLVTDFAALGFSTALPATAQSPTRHLFEVFPHATSLRLFGLEKVLPYKKGTYASRAQALDTLRTLISTRLASPPAKRRPALRLPPLPPVPATLAGLKDLEDRLDALLCAYTAAHYWYWHLSRNNILGDEATGFIVAPSY